MRKVGDQGCELLVLWLGESDPALRKATIAVPFIPKQRPISNESGIGYFVSGEELFELNKSLSETGLRLIAQVHSHPGRAYHSEADDRYAIVTKERGLSLVVPNFGRAPADPRTWAVYRLIDARWTELTSSECSVLFEMT
jgi:proteasome lid subunit RPN8/RPN11